MKNIWIKQILSVLATVGISLSVVAGGLPEDNRNDDLARELAKAQNALDKEKNRNDALEQKVDDLTNKVNDLASKEPAKAEPIELPIHGYIATSYADPDIDGVPGTFDQEVVDLNFTFKLNETFTAYADVAYLDGSEVRVDNGSVEGTGDIEIYEAWLDTRLAGDMLVMKIGKFFTPFGVWQPVEIPTTTLSVFNPVLVNWSIVPSSTTGIQEYGTYELGDIKLTQAVYVGNGKSYYPHSDDQDTNKALGSRIGLIVPFGSKDSDGFQAGINGYIGRDSTDDNDYQEKAFGLDSRLDLFDVTLRFETIKSRTNADDFVPGIEEGHIWRFAWFGQLSYNFLEKYDVYYRHDVGDEDYRYIDSGDIRVNSYGMSYRPIKPVVFKLEYDRYNVDEEALGNYNVYSGQVAVQF